MKQKLCALLLVLVFLVSACSAPSRTDAATPTPYPTPVRTTFTVQRGDIVVTAKLFGRVSPKALESAAFQMDGHVGSVAVNVGDTVKAGQLLGELSELKDLQAKASDTRRVIRDAQIDVEIAKLTLEKYQAEGKSTYDIQIQQLEVEKAQLELDKTLANLGIDPNSDALQALDAQVTKARAFAPADGVIIAVPNVGRSVTASVPVFVLGDPTQLDLVASLTSESGSDQIKQMYEGMAITAWRDAVPDKKLTGKISQLPSPYGTGPSDATDILISLDQGPSANTYQAGDKMTVQVELANKSQILWLPPNAIRQAGGRTFVIVNDASGPKRIDIQIGVQTSDKVEIVSGLSEGQVVLGP